MSLYASHCISLVDDIDADDLVNQEQENNYTQYKCWQSFQLIIGQKVKLI